MPINHAWLDKVQEAPIDPDYPVIDTHHHLWLEKPNRDFVYRIEDMGRDATSGHNVLATVFVQTGAQYRKDGPEHLKPVGETEWVHRCADDYACAHPKGPALCAGIVGHVDFRHDPALVDEALQAHKAASPRFRGIRQTGTWSDDDEINQGRPIMQRHLYRDPAFRKSFARLAKHGLSFDAWVFHDQMPELIDLARAFPDTQIVCEHLGGPLGQGRWASQRAAVLQDWKKSISELAHCPNVHMKLGGSVMPMFGFHWEKRPLPPSSDELVKATGHFFEHVIESFSPSRCMFESNFPVDKIACGYVPLWNSFKKIAARYTKAECANLFVATAARVYRLQV